MRAFNRGGVPVLKRSISNPSRCSAPLIPAVVPSPALPPAVLRFAGMHDRLQKCAGGQDNRLGEVLCIATNGDADDSLTPATVRFGDQVFDHFLPQVEIFLLFDLQLDVLLVGLFVGLGAGAVHGRPFAAIQQAKLNSGCIDRSTHQSAQGVDFADDLPFGDTADRRIARHLPDRVQIGRQQCRFRTQPRGGGRGFGSRVTGPDHDDVVLIADGGSFFGIDRVITASFGKKSVSPAADSFKKQQLFLPNPNKWECAGIVRQLLRQDQPWFLIPLQYQLVF